jgi:predicted molibdopterin-dependent oxidoreductase YjgC
MPILFEKHILRFLYKNSYGDSIFVFGSNCNKLENFMEEDSEGEYDNELIKPYYYNKNYEKCIKIKGCDNIDLIPNNLYIITLKLRKWKIKDRQGYVLDCVSCVSCVSCENVDFFSDETFSDEDFSESL